MLLFSYQARRLNVWPPAFGVARLYLRGFSGSLPQGDRFRLAMPRSAARVLFFLGASVAISCFCNGSFWQAVFLIFSHLSTFVLLWFWCVSTCFWGAAIVSKKFFSSKRIWCFIRMLWTFNVVSTGCFVSVCAGLWNLWAIFFASRVLFRGVKFVTGH